MARYLITLHTHGSWLADRDEGFTRRKHRGILPPEPALGRAWRRKMQHGLVRLEEELQRPLVEAMAAAADRGIHLYTAGTCVTHVHLLLGATDGREPRLLRRRLKRAGSMAMKARGQPLPFFSEGGSVYRVGGSARFSFYRDEYLPSHPGWFFDTRSDWRPPRRQA